MLLLIVKLRYIFVHKQQEINMKKLNRFEESAIKLAIKLRHSLLSNPTEIADLIAKDINDVSLEESRLILRQLYADVFKEYLEMFQD